MSANDYPPGGERGDLRPEITQRAFATHNAKVMQAARDQYIVNLGNILWVTVPTVLVVAGLLLYQVIGRPVSTLGSPVNPGKPSAGSVHRPTSVTGAAARHSAPLAVALSYDRYGVDNGAGPCMQWMFKRALSAIPAPPGVPSLDETWAHQYGGIDQNVTNFKLGVQGLTPNAVELTGFRVMDVQRVPAVHGTDIISTDGCGPSTSAGFFIALGHEPPTVTKAASITGLTKSKAIPFPFVVSSTDIQEFQVTAGFSDSPGSQASCNCIIKWRLALDWSYEGRAGTTVIDDNGKPFQTIFLPYTANTSTQPWFDGNGVWKHLG